MADIVLSRDSRMPQVLPRNNQVGEDQPELCPLAPICQLTAMLHRAPVSRCLGRSNESYDNDPVLRSSYRATGPLNDVLDVFSLPPGHRVRGGRIRFQTKTGPKDSLELDS